MEERPPGVRRTYRRPGAGRHVAALAGVLVGFGLLAAIAYAVVGGDDGPSRLRRDELGDRHDGVEPCLQNRLPGGLHA